MCPVICSHNFAIISHPDAGKTTLTEKLLLYGGAIQEAGTVKARRTQRSATSDWMEMEQQRGISITSTVLQFEYDQCMINLLDTPGHQDLIYRLGQATANILYKRESQLLKRRSLAQRLGDFSTMHTPDIIRHRSYLLAYPTVEDVEGSYAIIVVAQKK